MAIPMNRKMTAAAFVILAAASWAFAYWCGGQFRAVPLTAFDNDPSANIIYTMTYVQSRQNWLIAIVGSVIVGSIFLATAGLMLAKRRDYPPPY
jgi:hypothetical protein